MFCGQKNVIISSERHECLVYFREIEIIRLNFLSSNDQKSCAYILCVQQDEDSEYTLATDFEIGHFFRERIVPRAVLYFTGEALDDDESVRISWLFLALWYLWFNRVAAIICDIRSFVCVCWCSLKRRNWMRVKRRWVHFIQFEDKLRNQSFMEIYSWNHVLYDIMFNYLD